MRHKYETSGIVLSRSPLGETNAFVTVLTPDLGLVRARAQGVRRSGAKLAHALTTFTESELVLVRGKEGWRVTGAVLEVNWFTRLPHVSSRTRAARISHLLLRLVPGEVSDPALFSTIKGFFEALATFPEDVHESAEVLAALRILATLGFDAGEMPSGTPAFTPEILADVTKDRSRYIARINHGITASEL
jgi:DNA repair protein RecO (recombination protein O)